MRTKIKQATLLVIALLAWVALVALQVGPWFGFGMSGLLGLGLVALLLGFFVAAIMGMITRRWRATLFFGVALFIGLSSSWAADFISIRQREASIVAAQPIIAAAERFYSTTGTYPQALRDLVPVYLPSEPRTKMGFRGTPFDVSARADGFTITFVLPAWMLCRYDSESKQWDIVD